MYLCTPTVASHLGVEPSKPRAPYGMEGMLMNSVGIFLPLWTIQLKWLTWHRKGFIFSKLTTGMGISMYPYMKTLGNSLGYSGRAVIMYLLFFHPKHVCVGCLGD